MSLFITLSCPDQENIKRDLLINDFYLKAKEKTKKIATDQKTENKQKKKK